VQTPDEPVELLSQPRVRSLLPHGAIRRVALAIIGES
jgi:hypothetical protein